MEVGYSEIRDYFAEYYSLKENVAFSELRLCGHIHKEL